MTQPHRARAGLRSGLPALAGATCAGVAAELALSRHWTQPTQLIAWVALGIVLSSVVVLARRPGAEAVRAVGAGCVLVLVASLVGVALHVWGNYQAGPLDQVYGERWDSMPESERWWLALSQRVGPSPVIVPLVLAQVAAMVWLLARPVAADRVSSSSAPRSER